MNEYQRIVFSQTGQAQDILTVQTYTLAPLAAGELRVRMIAAPVNPADINFVQGVYGLKPQFPNSTAGLEGVGIVEQSTDADFPVGAQVIMLDGMGSWSEQLIAPASSFLKIPYELDPIQASMLKVNPLTAYLVLTQFVDLKPGDWIVQNAANSGVGRCVIQLCKAMGLRTINFVRHADKLRDELMALGADIVLAEDDEDVVKKAIIQMGGIRPVLASNCVGGESAMRLMDMLAPHGTMVTFGAMSKKSIKVPNGWLIFKDITLKGLWCTQWLKNASLKEIQAAYDHLAAMMADGKLCQAVDSIYPLSDIINAVTRAQEEYRGGKIILQISK